MSNTLEQSSRQETTRSRPWQTWPSNAAPRRVKVIHAALASQVLSPPARLPSGQSADIATQVAYGVPASTQQT